MISSLINASLSTAEFQITMSFIWSPYAFYKLIICGHKRTIFAVIFLIFLLQVAGEISYNGYKIYGFVPQKTSTYISQYDRHLPEMTMRETIDFSACCQGVGSRAGKIPCFLHVVINRVIVHSYPYVFPIFHYTDLMMEVSRREKEAGIVPDPDIDTYMKVLINIF